MDSNERFNVEDLAFEVTLPSTILLNRNLDASAIRLYGFIKSLTRLKGYCYASNAYLAFLMDLKERQISNLIKDLSNEGFIEVDTEKKGINWQRRIYLGVEFKKTLRNAKNCTPPGNLLPPPTQYIATDIRDIDNTSIIEEEREKSQSSSPPSQKKKPKEEKIQVVDRVYITKSQEESLLKKAAGSSDLVKRWYTHLSEWKIGKDIDYRPNDYKAINDWVIGAVEERSKNAPENDSKGSNFMQRVEKVISVEKMKTLEIYHSYVELRVRGSPVVETFYFADKNFKTQMLNVFRKLQAPMRIMDYLEGKTEDL